LTREQVMNDVLLAAQPTKRFVEPVEVAAPCPVPVPSRSGQHHRRQPQRRWRLDGAVTMRSLTAFFALVRSRPARPMSAQPRGQVANAGVVADGGDPRGSAAACASGAEPLSPGWRRPAPPGTPDAISREGNLLEPDAALGGSIANGDYRCRVIKLGARSPGLLPFLPYPSFNCRIFQSGRLQSFTKLSGSQRQVGYIFPHDQLRTVFLGTLVLGDEQRGIPYGADSDRDLAGFVERIGPARFRLILPSPRFESLVDIVELVPTS
jgi:hypothetical protein